MTDDITYRSPWRSKGRWALLCALSLSSALVASIWFDDVFPIVSVELDMERAEALERAAEIAEAAGWESADFRRVASFGQVDREVQTYVETEGGGAEAWEEIVEAGQYHPYLWTVRQFREQTTRESRVRFTPAGTPYGFRLRLPEDEPGESLPQEEARALAEDAAVSAWGMATGEWTLVESSQEVQTGGRTDHTFVYQAVADRFGEARYRLRLVVLGAQLGEVTRYVEVPEAFSRRYEEMRSANELIAFISQMAAGLLYLVLGCGVGLFLLMRQGWLVWGKALVWAGVVALLMFGAQLNAMPLSWVGYDTAVPANSFRTTLVITAILALLGIFLYVGLAFAAGESLTRRAFPRQLQLWRLWSPGVVNSRTVLGLTLGGYVFAGFFVAYVVAFYMFATRVLGWTLSADALIDPDALATPLPWISAVGTSLFAGFSEEALFRAVPLAGAALLAARYGGRGRWIAGALIVQALIFAAGHANYPQQPPYARVVELFTPAVALGIVYVRFGLLPGVVAHYLYDLAWFSLPLFATPFSAALATKVIILLAAAAPLAVVVIARARWGVREAPVPGSTNADWSPETEGPPETSGVAAAPPPAAAPAPAPRPAAAARAPGLAWAAAAGLLGTALWAATTDFSPEGPRMEVRGAAARAAAVTELEARAVDPSQWRVTPLIGGGRGGPHRFVWQTAGEDAYRALQGRFLAAPRWEVRFARFEGTQEERAEEWRVFVDANGEVGRVVHALPEARPGASLSEGDARILAVEALARGFGYGPADLDEVSAEASSRPARGDWTFTFRAPPAAPLPRGETRVQVEVAGDEVVDVRRLVDVPEEWEREDRARQSLEGVYRLPAGAILGLLALAGVGVAISRWARGSFAVPVFIWTMVGFAGWALVQLGNGWVATTGRFQTSAPWGTQVATTLGANLFLALLGGAALGLVAGMVHTPPRRGSAGPSSAPWIGLATGALLAGLAAAARTLREPDGPSWPSYGPLESLLPSAAVLLQAVLALFVFGLALMLVVLWLRRVEEGAWGWKGAAAAALLLGLSLAFTAMELPVWTAAARGIALAAVIYGLHALTRRMGAAILPAAAAGMLALGSVQDAVVNAYPGARAAYVAAALLVVGLGALWSRRLARI